jgi:hypothetical protein
MWTALSKLILFPIQGIKPGPSPETIFTGFMLEKLAINCELMLQAGDGSFSLGQILGQAGNIQQAEQGLFIATAPHQIDWGNGF